MKKRGEKIHMLYSKYRYTPGRLRYGNILIGFSEYECPYCKLLTDFSEGYITLRCFIIKSKRIPYICPSCNHLMVIDSSRHKLIKKTKKENLFQINEMMRKINEFIDNMKGISNNSKKDMKYDLTKTKKNYLKLDGVGGEFEEGGR